MVTGDDSLFFIWNYVTYKRISPLLCPRAQTHIKTITHRINQNNEADCEEFLKRGSDEQQTMNE